MTIRDQISRERYRKDERVTAPESLKKEQQDMTSGEIAQMRALRQREREQQQLAGPDDGREMFKLAEECARCEAPVDTDLNPGNPEAAGLMADTGGMMQVDALASGDSDSDMADLMVPGDTKGGFGSFLNDGEGGFF